MELDDFTLGWLIGLLEGEGTFIKGAPSAPNQVIIACEMTDEDTIAKLAAIFNVKYRSQIEPTKPHYKRLHMVRLRGKRAYDLMVILKPYMSFRRQDQIQKALDSYDPLFASKSQRKYSNEQVREIRRLFSEGKSINNIVNEIGVTRRFIYRIIHENKYRDVI